MTASSSGCNTSSACANARCAPVASLTPETVSAAASASARFIITTSWAAVATAATCTITAGSSVATAATPITIIAIASRTSVATAATTGLSVTTPGSLRGCPRSL